VKEVAEKPHMASQVRDSKEKSSFCIQKLLIIVQRSAYDKKWNDIGVTSRGNLGAK